MLGAISKDDQRDDARGLPSSCCGLRNELHFHAGKSNDVLDRSEQLAAGASCTAIEGTEGILPVEQFMRRLLPAHQRRAQRGRQLRGQLRGPDKRLADVWGTLFSHQVEGDYRVTPKQIAATHARPGQAARPI